VHASTLHFTSGAGAVIIAGGVACTLAPPLPAAGVFGRAGATRLGGTIGTPMFALGVADGSDGASGAGGAGDADTCGGAAARSPASVLIIGDIGADSQSSPSSTLPSVITSTAP
jgi:hypothetical protein